MTVFILRGSHANEYELQNYYPLSSKFDIRVVTTGSTLTSIDLPSIRLWSPVDLPNFPFRRQIFNRLIGGEQWLVGLEQFIQHYHNSTVPFRSSIERRRDNRRIIHTAETYTPYTHQAVQMRKNGLINHLVCTCWETIPHNNEKFARLRKWKQEAYQYVDIFHTPTHLAKKALVKEGVDAKKIVVIPYGVNLDNFPNPERKMNSKHPTILTVARQVPEKGMAIINEVAQLLPNYQFLIVGEGYYPFTASNIKTQKLNYREMPAMYHKADLFFFPSLSTPTWEEQYGMVLVEAMASGLPIITSKSGAIPEVVGEYGTFINTKNIPEIALLITKTLTNKSKLKKIDKKYSALRVSKNLAALYT